MCAGLSLPRRLLPLLPVSAPLTGFRISRPAKAPASAGRLSGTPDATATALRLPGQSRSVDRVAPRNAGSLSAALAVVVEAHTTAFEARNTHIFHAKMHVSY